MTASPEDVEREVRRLARKLEAKTDELAELFHDAAEAEVAYRVEYAKAVAEREAAATVYCEKLLWDRKTKEAVADAAREAARSLRDQISAVQSVGAMVRSQMELAR
jgi:hypothetical protein